MKRSKRMQTVERVVSEVEKKRAESLAACERRVSESETKLAELESYDRAIRETWVAGVRVHQRP